MKDPSKTEKPTQKKIESARKKGSIAKSQDASMAVVMFAAFLMLRAQWPIFYQGMAELMREYLGNFPHDDLTIADLSTLTITLLLKLLALIAPFMLTVLGTGIMINFVQVGRLWSWQGVKPDFSRINPIAGFQRFLSARQAVETLKGILKISLLVFIAYQVLSDQFWPLISSVGVDPASLGALLGQTGWTIVSRCMWALVLIGAFDYFYQRYEYNESLKMTKQEVDDESKQMELPREVKGKMRERQAMLARQRMMSEVPKASVVITNPTHLAIAIRYERKDEEVPVVLAKGADKLAERIKAIAREANVPIVENKPIARALFREVEIGEEIPKDLYSAVAEILVMVTRLAQRRS